MAAEYITFNNTQIPITDIATYYSNNIKLDDNEKNENFFQVLCKIYNNLTHPLRFKVMYQIYQINQSIREQKSAENQKPGKLTIKKVPVRFKTEVEPNKLQKMSEINFSTYILDYIRTSILKSIDWNTFNFEILCLTPALDEIKFNARSLKKAFEGEKRAIDKHYIFRNPLTGIPEFLSASCNQPEKVQFLKQKTKEECLKFIKNNQNYKSLINKLYNIVSDSGNIFKIRRECFGIKSYSFGNNETYANVIRAGRKKLGELLKNEFILDSDILNKLEIVFKADIDSMENKTLSFFNTYSLQANDAKIFKTIKQKQQNLSQGFVKLKNVVIAN